MTAIFRSPHQGDLEVVVAHFLRYLSNEPGKDGLSARMRFYGMLPVQAKLLFPDLPDEVFTNAVTQVIAATSRQT